MPFTDAATPDQDMQPTDTSGLRLPVPAADDER
jgi:hypothetical protein